MITESVVFLSDVRCAPGPAVNYNGVPVNHRVARAAFVLTGDPEAMLAERPSPDPQGRSADVGSRTTEVPVLQGKRRPGRASARPQDSHHPPAMNPQSASRTRGARQFRANSPRPSCG